MNLLFSGGLPFSLWGMSGTHPLSINGWILLYKYRQEEASIFLFDSHLPLTEMWSGVHLAR